jgi:hypothetical protein
MIADCCQPSPLVRYRYCHHRMCGYIKCADVLLCILSSATTAGRLKDDDAFYMFFQKQKRSLGLSACVRACMCLYPCVHVRVSVGCVYHTHTHTHARTPSRARRSDTYTTTTVTTHTPFVTGGHRGHILGT